MKIPALIGLATAGLLGASPLAVSNAPAAFFGGYQPPAECRAWYDGCNMCDKTADGKVTCTDRACREKGKGFCKAYFPDIPNSSAIASSE